MIDTIKKTDDIHNKGNNEKYAHQNLSIYKITGRKQRILCRIFDQVCESIKISFLVSEINISNHACVYLKMPYRPLAHIEFLVFVGSCFRSLEDVARQKQHLKKTGVKRYILSVALSEQDFFKGYIYNCVMHIYSYTHTSLTHSFLYTSPPIRRLYCYTYIYKHPHDNMLIPS